MLLGEIVAQHLEHRLGHPVEHRLGQGETLNLYQSILAGDTGIYPEYTGMISSEILREPADPNPEIVLARVRREMARIAQVEVLDPLGFDNPTAMVVRVTGNEKTSTLSEAAAADKRWRLAMTYEFQTRADGFQNLAAYRLPTMPPRVQDTKQLYMGLQQGDFDLIAARVTDGPLVSPDLKVLADDRKVFPSYQACLLVRQSTATTQPGLLPALAELSGKISAEKMRQMNAEVDVKMRTVASVASEFLSQAGLK